MESRNIFKAAWLGQASHPHLLRIPGTLKLMMLAFYFTIVLLLVFFFVPISNGTITLEPHVNRIVVTSCYVHTTCDFTTVVPLSVSESTSPDGVLTIDGTASAKCEVEVCLNEGARLAEARRLAANATTSFTGSAAVTAAPIKFELTESVLRIDQSVAAAVEVRSYNNAKVFVGPGIFTDVYVNVSSGIAVFTDVISPAVFVNIDHGPAIISHSFEPHPVSPKDPTIVPAQGLIVDAVNENNNYCISQRMGTTTPGTCTATEVYSPALNSTVEILRCPLYTSFVSPTAANTTHFSVTSTSIYVNDRGNYTQMRLDQQAVLANVSDESGSRIAGEGMFVPARIDMLVPETFNDTAGWHAAATDPDYIQSVEVISPSFGVNFLHTNRRILLEIGPEYLAFYTLNALRPNYRHMFATMSHYRCPGSQAQEFLMAQSLVAPIVGADSGTDSLSSEAIAILLENQFPRGDQLLVAETLQESAGNRYATVAFTSPDLEYVDGSKSSGSVIWRTYELVPGANRTASYVTIMPSALVQALLAFSNGTALLVVIMVFMATVFYSRPVVTYILCLQERELYRSATGFNNPVPYHCFFGLLSSASWITFRLAIIIASKANQPLFLAFLERYFRRNSDVAPKKVDIEGAKAAERSAVVKATKSTPLEILIARYDRFSMLRMFVGATTREEQSKIITQFGGRQIIQNRQYALGLVRCPSVRPSAKFVLEFSSLQSFYEVTRQNRDSIQVDELYQRVLIEDPTASMDGLLQKLKQWRFEVVARPTPVVLDVQPRGFTKASLLTPGEMRRIVAELELNSAAVPSYGFVISQTLGPDGGKAAIATRWGLGFLEVFLTSFLTLAPFLLAFMCASILTIEHGRYSTTTFSLSPVQLRESFNTVAVPRPRNPLTMGTIILVIVFGILAMIEPLLVMATFRIAATFNSERFRVRDVLLVVRGFFTLMTFLSMAIVIIFLLWYVVTVAIWWVLGAIIAPTHMLVFASAVFATGFLIVTSIQNMRTMQKLARKRLEERILEELLKMIRNSPAGDMFDAIEDEAEKRGLAGGQNVEISAGLLLDVVSSETEVSVPAIDKLCVALDVPSLIVRLVMALMQPQPANVRLVLGEILDNLDIPKELHAVSTQLCFRALEFPTRSAELVHALYDLVPEFKDRLMAQDETLIALTQAALSERVDLAGLIKIGVSVGMSKVSKLLHISPLILQQMFSCAQLVAQGQPKSAMTEGVNILTTLRPRIPRDPTILRPIFNAILEGLKMANDGEHNLREAVLDILQATPLRNTIQAKVLAPIIAGSKAVAQEAAAEAASMQATFDASVSTIVAVPKRGSPTVQSSDDAASVEACLHIAKQVAGLIEFKFALSNRQRDVFETLSNLLGGDVDALDDLDSRFTASGGKRHKMLLRALDRFDQMIVGWQHLACITKELAEAALAANRTDGYRLIRRRLGSLHGLTSALKKSRPSELFAAVADDTRRKSIIAHAEKVEAIMLPILEVAATQDAEDPVTVLEMWLLDQWAALGSLMGLRLSEAGLPPAMCDYTAFEDMTDVPGEGLQVFRSLVKSIMLIVRQVFGSLIDLQQLHEDLMEALQQANPVDPKCLDEKHPLIKKIFEIAKETLSSLVGDVFPPELEIPCDPGMLRQFSANVRKRVMNAADGVNVDLIAQATASVAANSTGMALSMAGAITGNDDPTNAQLAEISAAMAEKGDESGLQENGLVHIAAFEGSSGVAFRGELHDAIISVLSTMSSALMKGRNFDLADLTAGVKSLAMILLDHGKLGFLHELIGRDQQRQADFVDDLVDYFITRIPTGMLSKEATAEARDSLDLKNLARLLGVPVRAVRFFACPELVASKFPELSSLPMILEILRGTPIEAVMVTETIKTQLRPFLRLAGINDEDFGEVDDRIRFLTRNGVARAHSKKAAQGMNGVIGKISGAATDLTQVAGTAAKKSEQAKAGFDMTEQRLQQLKDAFLGTLHLRDTSRDISLIRTCQYVYMNREAKAMADAAANDAAVIDGAVGGPSAEAQAAAAAEERNKTASAGFDERPREARLAAVDLPPQFGKVVEEVIEGCFYGFSILKFWKNRFRAVRAARDLEEARAIAMQASAGLMRVMAQVTPFLHARIQELLKVRREEPRDPRLTAELHCVKVMLENMRRHPVVADFDTGLRRKKKQVQPINGENGAMAARRWTKLYGDVDNGDTGVNLDLIFANISPFMLLCDEVPDEARSLFGVLFGVTDWFPKDLPRVVSALITTLIRRRDTPRSVLGLLASQFPMRQRDFVLELAALATGDVHVNLMNCANAANLQGDQLSRIMKIFVPREDLPVDPEQLLAYSDDHKKYLVKPREPNWLALVASVARGDVFSILKWSSFFPFDTPCLAMAMTNPSRPRLQQLLLSMFPDNERLKMIAKTRANAIEQAERLRKEAEAKAKAEAQDAIGKHFPVLTDFMREHTPQLQRGFYLVTGAMMMYQARFAEATKAFEQFAGDNVRELTAVRIGTLAARLVIEDGAVSDKDTVLAAIGSLMHCLPMLDRNIEAALRLALEGVPFGAFGSMTDRIKKLKSVGKKSLNVAAGAVTDAATAATEALDNVSDADADGLEASIRAFEKTDDVTHKAVAGVAQAAVDPAAVGEELFQMITVVLPFLVSKLPSLMHTPRPVLPIGTTSLLQQVGEKLQRDLEAVVDEAKAEVEDLKDEAKQAAADAKAATEAKADEAREHAKQEVAKKADEAQRKVIEELEKLRAEAERRLEEARAQAQAKVAEIEKDAKDRATEETTKLKYQANEAVEKAEAALHEANEAIAKARADANAIAMGELPPLPGQPDSDSMDARVDEIRSGHRSAREAVDAASAESSMDDNDSDDDVFGSPESESLVPKMGAASFDPDDEEARAELKQHATLAKRNVYRFVKRTHQKDRLLDGAQENLRLQQQQLAESDEAQKALAAARARARELGSPSVEDVDHLVKMVRVLLPTLIPSDAQVHYALVDEVLDVVQACIEGIRDLVKSPKLSTAVDVLLKIVAESEEAVAAAKQIEFIQKTAGDGAAHATTQLLGALKEKKQQAAKAGAAAASAVAGAGGDGSSGGGSGPLANQKELLQLAAALKDILESGDSGPGIFLALLKKVADMQSALKAREALEAGQSVADAAGLDEFPKPPSSASGGGGGGGFRPSTAAAKSKLSELPRISVNVHISPVVLNTLNLVYMLSRGDSEALPEIFQLFGVDVAPAAVNKFRSTMRAIAALRDTSGSRDLAESAQMAASDLLRIVAESIFNELDADKSGLLSFQEFKVALERLHISVPEHEAQLIYDELDEDQSGLLSLDEFQTAIKNIRQRYLNRMLAYMGLTDEAIYIALIWLVLFLCFFITFLILGFLGFKDNSAFTASITALMPLMGSVSSQAKDAVNMARKLFDKVDDLVSGFFEALQETKVDVDVD